MIPEALGVAAVGAAATAWGVRGPSCSWITPTLWRGDRGRPRIALTFDDGPAESTPDFLDELARHGVRATFFVCGHHVRRLPEVARLVLAAGHEIGNHTDSHAALYLRGREFIEGEVSRAQRVIEDETGQSPSVFRPPYGARWFGLKDVLARQRLSCVMWTVIGLDWRLPGPAVAERLIARTGSGSVVCLHDGRGLHHKPDAASTLDAVRRTVPYWLAQGYEFVTVSELFGLRRQAGLSAA